MMKPEQQITLWADKLRDLSSMGLMFSKNMYDRENYETIQNIVVEMFAMMTDTPIDKITPLKASVLNRPTPFCGGDGAVIDTDGRILLIKRADNALWAMPGGALSVGETPAEGVVREVLEETGVYCQVTQFVGVFDSRFCGTTTPHHMYQFLFLCQPLEKESVGPSHELETLQRAWFLQDELPDDIDPGHITRIQYAFDVWAGKAGTFFDKPNQV